MNAKFKMPKLRGGSTDFWGASAVLSQALGYLSQALGHFSQALGIFRGRLRRITGSSAESL